KVQGRPIEVFSEIDIRLKEAVILSDHLLLNQVLMNLLSNAEKFTDQGEIGIDLHLINENDEKMEVAFWVYDTGIGIENDRLDRIFEKYEQVNQKTKYKYGGTGLGLAITKKIVEFLGGTVDVQSEPKVGSLFVVTLSFKKGVNKLHTQQNLGVEPRFAHTEYKYVLVAEDNVMNRKYINEIFKNTPIEIDFAHNGAVAVEMCKNKKYDIILMDLQMPEKDGFEATIEIRTHENKNNSTPIVGLSAYATEEVKAKTTLVGMDWFISKPFTPKQLKSLLNIETTEQQRKEKPTQQDNVIDYQLLEELYFGDAEYAYEMFDHFLDVIDEQVDELQSALDNNIWEEGRRLVHKIKPGFSMVGLPHLQEIGTNLEKACEEKDLNTIKVLFEQLIDQLKADLPHVRREHQNLKLKIS
ncbi:response regulator, partial [bacterium]|nr:response regulator [bacterium]